MRFQALLLSLLISAVHAQEWTRFRGPNGTGISHAKTIPTKITDSDINWKLDLPGTGHSSPLVWNEKLFLTVTGDKAGGLSMLCLNATTGQKLWSHDFKLTPFARHAFNSFASSTPAVDAQRVYVAWNEPEHFMLNALDHQGKVLWQRDFGSFVSQHGCGISPIVYQNRVYLGNEQDDASVVKENNLTGKSFVVAVDASNGKTVWQTPRNSAVVAYSTPCLYEPPGGKPAMIFNSQGHGIYAVEPDTGAVLWEFSKAFDKRSVSSPIIAGDIILGSCGSGGGGNFVTAIRAGDSNKKRAPELAWQLKRSAPYVPTGIASGDRAWLWSDTGIVTCVDPKNGDIKYQERVGGDFFGSPVWIDGRLFAVSTTGEMVVVPASDKFEVLHRYALNDKCHSTPAVAAGRLYIHTEHTLVSIGGEKKSPLR